MTSQSSVGGMEVDELNKKREREFYDSREDAEEGGLDKEEIPVPTELAPQEPQQQRLTLEDLMGFMKTGLQENKEATDRGVRENRENFSALSKEIASTKREAQEGKLMAAKATTLAQDTKNRLEILEKRVLQLEQNPTPNAPPGLSRNSPPPPQSKRDWDQLGGEDGDTAIVGGFRPFADKEEKQKEWDIARVQLPQELQNQIIDTIVPRSLGSIVIVKIRQQATTTDTRRSMIEWTQSFKKATVQVQGPDETAPRTFYAAPSKPFAMRQRNAQLSNTFEALKLIGGPEGESKLRMDVPSGRILHDRTVIVDRLRGTGEPTHHIQTMQRFFPTVTQELLDDKIEEVRKKRDDDRRSP